MKKSGKKSMKYRKRMTEMPEKGYDRYTVQMTQPAKRDLAEITRYIARNNPQTALKITDRIEAKINALDHFPERGAYIPQLLEENIKEYRQIIESPWKIIYKIDDEIVRILAIIDSRRNLKDILIEKLLK